MSDGIKIDGPYLTGAAPNSDSADFSWVQGGGNPFTEPAGNRVAQLLDAKAADYDSPEENFQRIASMWSALFSAKTTEPFTPIDVGLAMLCVKLTREVFRHNEDNVLDIEGYAECIRRVTANTAPVTNASLNLGSPGFARSYR